MKEAHCGSWNVRKPPESLVVSKSGHDAAPASQIQITFVVHVQNEIGVYATVMEPIDGGHNVTGTS